jgi:hypothetical protein
MENKAAFVLGRIVHLSLGLDPENHEHAYEQEKANCQANFFL